MPGQDSEPNIVEFRDKQEMGSGKAAQNQRLEPYLVYLRPMIYEAFSGEDIDSISRPSMAARISQIVGEMLEANQNDLNLLDRRSLVTILINELVKSGANATAEQSDPATPQSPESDDQQTDRSSHAKPSSTRRQNTPARRGAGQSLTADPAVGGSRPCSPSQPKKEQDSKVERFVLGATVEAARNIIQPAVMERIDATKASQLPREDLNQQVADIIAEIVAEQRINLNAAEKSGVIELILNDMLGLGPLEPLLLDDTINDIMVNGPRQVYVERQGKLELTQTRFRDDEHVMNVARRIVSKVGRRVDETTPMVDARLDDGSRVNIIIPPLAIDGPSISIRKFSKKSITLDIMSKQGNLSPQMATLLKIASRSRLNILISGGTGSGKTTLLNALSQMIETSERIVTIEDAAELQLQQPHVVRLETRPANLEGINEISMRDLVKNSLRMRPDRIILGEVRSAEAVDMLQAMNTGHDGSLGTIHANRPREALTRLENMIGLAGINLPAKAVRTQIANALDMIIQVSRMRDGMRRVTHVVEVVGMEGDVITTQDLYTFEFEGEDPTGLIKGQFRSSGLRPYFLPKAAYFGLDRSLMEIL